MNLTSNDSPNNLNAHFNEEKEADDITNKNDMSAINNTINVSQNEHLKTKSNKQNVSNHKNNNTHKKHNDDNDNDNDNNDSDNKPDTTNWQRFKGIIAYDGTDFQGFSNFFQKKQKP